MKIGAIIQARMSSTRLPGKIALELPYGSGITVLEQVVRRAKKCRLLDEVIIATTTGKEDNAVVRLAKKAGAKVFRGSKEDVLSRFYFAAKDNNLDVVVRITSDCPCIDPNLISKVIQVYSRGKADYSSNVLESPYPDGQDIEVFSFSALESVHLNSDDPKAREHVTFAIYSQPEKFRIKTLKAPKSLAEQKIRITLDTSEDYALLCAVYKALYKSNSVFSLKDLLNLLKRAPWLRIINRRVAAKKVFPGTQEELVEAVKILKMQDLCRAADFISARIRK
jgi:spore coat polysaccharide biosynthesis protein SpsF